MSSSESPHNGKYKLKNIFHRAETQLPLNSSKRLSVSKLQEVPTDESGQDRDLFWPADLLPQEFPSARILMFGYDSKVTKYMSKATNKSSLLSHSKDLVFSLGRERPQDRPLIILAHSLGGILVKEVSTFTTVYSSTLTKLRSSHIHPCQRKQSFEILSSLLKQSSFSVHRTAAAQISHVLGNLLDLLLAHWAWKQPP